MNIRQDIQGTTPQDLNKMNENFMSMWQKVYGNIDFADGNFNMKQRIMTQWIPIQGEGNLDSSYPLEIRFYIPPNVSKVKVSPLNVRSEHYRMDSGVAKGGGAVENVELALDMASANAIISTELRGITQSKPIEKWGGTGVTFPSHDNCTVDFYPSDDGSIDVTRLTNRYFTTSVNNMQIDLAPLIRGYIKPVGSSVGYRGWYADLGLFQHTHDISHTHQFTLSQQGHTHSGSGKINLEPHTHQLNEGIKVSTESPQNVEVFVNSMKVGNTLSGISSFSNVDISQYVIIGEWNVVKISCSNLARVVLYGIIELVNKY